MDLQLCTWANFLLRCTIWDLTTSPLSHLSHVLYHFFFLPTLPCSLCLSHRRQAARTRAARYVEDGPALPFFQIEDAIMLPTSGGCRSRKRRCVVVVRSRERLVGGQPVQSLPHRQVGRTSSVDEAAGGHGHGRAVWPDSLTISAGRKVELNSMLSPGLKCCCQPGIFSLIALQIGLVDDFLVCSWIRSWLKFLHLHHATGTGY
jgi:hypothetical protein